MRKTEIPLRAAGLSDLVGGVHAWAVASGELARSPWLLATAIMLRSGNHHEARMRQLAASTTAQGGTAHSAMHHHVISHIT
jgi:hypothetical protein